MNAIAAEVGVSHHAVGSALRRHGLDRMAHAAKRHAASERAAQVAARLRFGSMAGYVTDRRAAGWTWRAMAEESGQPQSWLRRQARDAQARAGLAGPALNGRGGFRAGTGPAGPAPARFPGSELGGNGLDLGVGL